MMVGSTGERQGGMAALLQPAAVLSALCALAAVSGDTVACDCSRDVLVAVSDAAAEAGEGGSPAQGGQGGVMIEPVVLAVALGEPRGTISPLIYGMEISHDGAPDPRNRPTAIRYASFWISPYNWEINAANGGETWCWENGAFFGFGGAGAALRELFSRTRRVGATAVAHVPIGPYVAADTMGGPGQVDGMCPADVRATPDFLRRRFRVNVPAKGTALSQVPDTSDGFVYQDEFASWVRRTADGAPVLFALDFLPERWHGIFNALYPQPITYADMLARNLEFARAIKSVFPETIVVASALSGWPGVRHLSWAQDRSDLFFNWFLRELRVAHEREGQRVIDMVAVDWGPTLPQQADAEALRSARLQSPRSLWDPTYDERSWISAELGGPVRLIPRLLGFINQESNYPGTRLAFNGWSFGVGGSIDGALLAADVLGIFGREGVSFAVMRRTRDNAFSEAGFRAYRNFDGQGAAFGDISLGAISADPSQISIYASADSGQPGRYVFVVINKAAIALPVEIGIGGDPGFVAAEVYRVTAQRADLVQAPEALAMWAPGKLRDTLPAHSITVYRPRTTPGPSGAP